MLTLRLTHKVIKESQLPNASFLILPEHGDVMEDWYVNLFMHEKRKHLLFTHAGSLVSFVAAGVYRQDVKDLEKIFKREFMKFLEFYKFDEQDIAMLQSALNETRFAKTMDRRVTRLMADCIRHYKWYVSDTPHHKEYSPEDYALYQTNRVPLKSFKYASAIEVFHNMVTGLKSFHHIPGHRAVGLN